MEKSLLRDLSWVPARSYYENLAEGTLLTIWRRRGLIIATLALSVAVAGVALSVMKKKYTAEAIVQLDVGRREAALDNGSPSSVMLDGASIVQGEAKIIRSRLMARRVVQKLSLDAATAPDRSTPLLDSFFDTILSAAQHLASQLGLGIAQMDESRAPIPVDNDRAIRTVMSRLTVEADNRSYLITIGYTSSDPIEAAKIANTFAEEYLLRHRELSSHLANHVTEWFSGQIHTAKAAQQEAEGAIDAFRQRTGVLDVGPSGENVQQQQLRDLNTQLSTASLARLNEENRLNRVRRVIAAGGTPSAADLQGIPLIQSLAANEAAARKELSELTSSHGSHYPEVVRAQAALSELQASLRTAMGRAVSIIDADLAAAKRAEQDLKNQLESLQRKVVNSKAHEAELHDLQANAQTARERVASLIRSYDQAVTAYNLQPMAGSLISPAEPVSTPSSPKPLIIFSIALIGGLGSGVAAALVNERRDRGFRTSREVAASTGLRCLGMLPEAVRRRRNSRDTPSTDEIIFGETVRSLGTGVGLFGTPGTCRVVMVTSSLPGEGKSTICMALARQLVGVGQRVLLIDSTRSREASAPVLLIASSTASEPARVRPRFSTVVAEVFGPKLDRLIEEARKQFDVVLIEGPPVMLLADSFVIGRQADVVIHAIHWRKTMKSTVLNALQRLQDQSVRVDGTILTRVVPREHRKFGLEDECSHYISARRFFEKLSVETQVTPPLAEPGALLETGASSESDNPRAA